jgi:FixJ family two-component response regulator
MASLPLISIVDDDQSVRESLQRLVRSAGFAVRVFASGEEFWESEYLQQTHCLILDMRMPGMNGRELHRHLRDSHCAVPVVFITAHGNESARSQALAEGAIDYLFKPFSEQALLNAIQLALSVQVATTPIR